MRERLPGLIAVALLVALVVATWWAADYTARAVALDPPRRLTHEPDAWARNFVLLRSDPQGVAINRLEGEAMQHFPDDDSTQVSQARATGHQVDAPPVTGTADTATLDQGSDRITLRGNAHVHRAADGQTPALDVTSDTLTLLIPQDVVTTAAPAVVVRGASVMHGTGMHYNNKTKILNVHAEVDVRIAGGDQGNQRNQGGMRQD